jgi:hypothetical protein
VQFDAREAGRVVATVVLAGGAATADALGRASAGLARLGRPPLSDRDLVVSTPEQLAALIPVDLREGLAALLIDLSSASGSSPCRGRRPLRVPRLPPRGSRGG